MSRAPVTPRARRGATMQKLRFFAVAKPAVVSNAPSNCSHQRPKEAKLIRDLGRDSHSGKGAESSPCAFLK